MLVHAAAGGVGLLLTQIAKLRGGRVIATTSTEEKAELARGAGADEVIGYEGFAERVRELTGGEGVAVVYDGVGARHLRRAASPRCARAASWCSTAPRAGRAAGRRRPACNARLALPDPPDARPLRARRATSCAARPATCSGGSPTAALERPDRRPYPLADARKAHEDLEARRTTGKLLLDPRA